MKYSAVIFIFLLTWVTASAQEPSLELFDKIGKTKAGLYLKKVHFAENKNYAAYDLTYQRMEWEIDPAVKFIKGAITSYFILNDPAIESIQFDLKQNITVDSIKIHNQLVEFVHQDNVLKIPYNPGLNIPEPDSITVFYQGVPDASGFGSFEQAEHNGIPIIWTLSEPYGAMEWWPCKQSLADKIDSIDVVVTCPELYRTASNGVLASETVHDGHRTMVWKHRHPIATYLVAIAVTNYVDYSDYVELENGDSIQILNYVYPENLEDTKGKTAQTVEIMELYNRLFGTYRFADEKYGHAQFGWGGGMEHQTMSFMGAFSFDLIAHELSHQWFGDYVTLTSWQDIWLNEGFATFVTGLAYQNLLGGVWCPVWRQKLVERITSEPGGSVYVRDTTDVSRIFDGRLSYYKGAYLLHMLRWLLSDETFFRAVNNYLNAPETAYGFATNEELIYHLEAASDTTLVEFFNDWYYGEGYPTYSIQYAQNSDHLLKINLFQETSHESVGFFEMAVPVRCYNSGKTDSVDFRLENLYNGQVFIVDPGFQASEIKIDPDLWLISKVGEALSVPWLDNPEDIFIFPNPAAEEINLVTSHGIEISRIEILDTSGKKMADFSGNLKNVKLSGLPSATYILRIQTTGGSTIRKIIKL